MAARRTSSAVALIVGASGLMLTCVFGFLSFVPGVDPSMTEFFQLGFFVGGVVTLGSLVGYFFLSRKDVSGEPVARFDRYLQQRKAALGALPIGLVAVGIGALWYIIQAISPAGFPAPKRFTDFNTPGVIAFLGFGCAYVTMATWLAIRAERSAIRAAREDAEVTP
jgi:hypothetical protein